MAQFELALVDKVSSVADRMGVSISRVTDAMEKLEEASKAAKAVEAAKEAMGLLPPKVDEVTAAMDKLNEQMRQQKVMDEAKRRLGLIKEEAPPAAAAVKSFSSAADDLARQMFPASASLEQFGPLLAAIGPYGIIAAAAVAVAAVALAGLAVALYHGASAAIAFSQEKDAMLATFSALAGGQEAAEKLADLVDEMALKLPFTGDQIGTWAKSLLGAGVAADALEGKITAIASAAAIMGTTGGAAAEKVFKQLAEGGDGALTMVKQVQSGGTKAARALSEMGIQSADIAAALGVTVDEMKKMTLTADQVSAALEKALVTKGAGALETMGLTWNAIMGDLKDSFGDLFEDLGEAVRPFMAEVKALFAEFGVGSSSATAAKGVVTSVFTDLFAVATKVVHALHIGFLQVQIAVLKVAIAIAPAVLWLRELFASSTFLTGLKVMFILVGAAIFIATLPLLILIAAFVILVVVVTLVVGAIVEMVAGAWAALTQWATDAATAAGDFIQGLVSGIAGGASAVIDAVKGVAGGAVDAFKSALGISSPSKVMMRFGGYTAEGFAAGMDAGGPLVGGAAQRMGGEAAAAIVAGPAPGRGPGALGGRGGAGLNVTFGPNSIVIDGAGNSAMEITEEMIAMVFERVAASQGLVGAPS